MAYNAETRAKARNLFESGVPRNQISKKLTIDYNTLLAWERNDGWEKNKLVPQIQEEIHKTTLELAIERGLTKGRIIDKIANLLDAQKPVGLNENGDDGPGVIYADDSQTQVKAARLAVDVLGMVTLKEEINIKLPQMVQIETADGNKISAIGSEIRAAEEG